MRKVMVIVMMRFCSFCIILWLCVTFTDINECELRDACQHECMNTPGSHRCLCPAGYRVMTNGKTCQGERPCRASPVAARFLDCQ